MTDVDIRIVWHGAHITQQVKDAVNEALLECGEDLLRESGMLVPLNTGILEGSGEVSQNEIALTANVSYDTPYAKRQHEDTRIRHASPRQAKYLEKPFNLNARKYKDWIRRKIHNALNP